MYCSHAVYGIAIVDIDMGHMDSLFIIDDPYLALILMLLLYPVCQLLDNGNQNGNHLFQIGERPLFQCFRQNGVVGICTGL